MKNNSASYDWWTPLVHPDLWTKPDFWVMENPQIGYVKDFRNKCKFYFS